MTDAATRYATIAMAPHARALPSAVRLAVLAMLLPAAFAATNYALLFHANYRIGRVFLYPWMAFSTAVLSWCIGRYLWPAWLRWLVFGWALVLLDLFTFSACLGGLVEGGFGYILVTSQIGFLVLWATLSRQRWQVRLPLVIVGAAVVVGFSGSFDDSWDSRAWNVMMFLTAVLVSLLCAGLRCLGFLLRRKAGEIAAAADDQDGAVYQFGTRHMLIWATAIAPLLLVARGLSFVFVDLFVAQSVLPAVVLVVSLATVCLIAIWAVLGSGRLAVCVAVLLLIPPALGAVMRSMTKTSGSWSIRWRSPILSAICDIGDGWILWMALMAALLAALLLFLRADGYRLSR